MECIMENINKNNSLISIDNNNLKKFKPFSTVHTYNKGDYIFQAGSFKKNFYLLLSGRVKLYRVSSQGREVTQWFCFPGEAFGLSELQSVNQQTVSAQSSEESEVISIPLNNFNQFILQSPETALQIIKQLSIRLKIAGDTLLNLTADNVKTRLIKLIIRLNMRYGIEYKKGKLINVVLTHKEIADMIGSCRQTVTSLLGELKVLGDIKIVDQHIFIPSPNKFEKLIEVNDFKYNNEGDTVELLSHT